jgi:hypothetical protein
MSTRLGNVYLSADAKFLHTQSYGEKFVWMKVCLNEMTLCKQQERDI